MLDSRVKALADALGCKLVERNASESFVYDGESLALYRQYEGDEDNYAPHPRKYATDHSILHELGHLAGAREEQRDLPEFGLMWGVVVSEATGGIHGPELGRIIDGVVMDKDEEDVQEHFAQMFATFFGKVWDLKTAIGYGDGWKPGSWEDYFLYKDVYEAMEHHPDIYRYKMLRQEAKVRLWNWLHENFHLYGEIM